MPEGFFDTQMLSIFDKTLFLKGAAMENEMEFAKKKLIAFIEDFPLYKTLTIKFKDAAPALALPMGFKGMAFSGICPEDGRQTFKMRAEPPKLFSAVAARFGPGNPYDDKFEFMDHSGQYNYFQHYSAQCQHCLKFSLNYLLYINSSSDGNIYFRKVGQFPPFEIAPDLDLIKYLSEEDKQNYKKALICLSQNYGMGAFAYLRRIVQNEIEKIVMDLSKIDRPESQKIRDQIATYKKDHQMEKLISAIGPYMPSSFNGLGENPLKYLYSQLSGGIHEFTDDECANKADSINTVLIFVIKRLNDENSELKKVREALRNKGK